MAHKFAMVHEQITADMVESSEFSFLAVKYKVQSVPHTVINEDYSLVGAPSEIEFVRKILEVIGR